MSVLPAMGYSPAQLDDLAATIRSCAPDVVVTGTPMDLRRLIDVGMPIRQARYELQEIGTPTLSTILSTQPWFTPVASR